MFVGFLFIVLGVVTEVWAGWLLPHWMRNAVGRRHHDHADPVIDLESNGVRLILVFPRACGVLLIVAGIALALW
jgi:hypothetical protein